MCEQCTVYTKLPKSTVYNVKDICEATWGEGGGVSSSKVTCFMDGSMPPQRNNSKNKEARGAPSGATSPQQAVIISAICTLLFCIVATTIWSDTQSGIYV